MSVTSLLKLPDVREQLRRLVPTSPARIDAALLAPPLTKAYALIGTAFDYAARFELQRRYPHARTEPWVAEAALGRLPLYTQDAKIVKAAARLVEKARVGIEVYVHSKDPTPDEQESMAAHAIRLAKLDPAFRAGYVDPLMGTAEPDNVNDVLRLLDIAPLADLAHPTTLWLNPTFGDYSHLVGGADCDLVSGDRLIDIKVTKNDALDSDYLLQLVSYAILGRAAHSHARNWPEVRHVGIYFARHAHLWMTPVESIYSHTDYQDVEAWYFKRAAREFRTRIPRSPKVAPMTHAVTHRRPLPKSRRKAL